MKNGIWHPADFEGKNAGEEKTKEKTAVAIAYTGFDSESC